jgi:hypothetical protein
MPGVEAEAERALVDTAVEACALVQSEEAADLRMLEASDLLIPSRARLVVVGPIGPFGLATEAPAMDIGPAMAGVLLPL